MTIPTQENSPIVCEVTRASGRPVDGTRRHILRHRDGRAAFGVEILTFDDAAALLEWVRVQDHAVVLAPARYPAEYVNAPAWSLEIYDDYRE